MFTRSYQGSYDVITDERGNVLERLSFDPWGRRRNPENWTFNNIAVNHLFDRGYTGHEHLDVFSLINMNGRVYDPWLGRFLSPDPIVQSPGYSQSYNRYSYCFNNPLKYSDPSGFTALEDIIDDLMNSAYGGTWSPGAGTYYFESEGEALDFATGKNHNQGSSSDKKNNKNSIKNKNSKNNQQNRATFNNLLTDIRDALLGQGGMMYCGTLEQVLETIPTLDLTSTPWMDTALGEYNLGVKEEPLGSNSGPRVDEYLKYAGISSPNKWCAAFVNWCLGQNNIKGAGAIGIDYLNWGTKLEVPKYGAIVIFNNYHVGFYMGENADGTLKILHGNWSNRVTISSGIYDPIKPDQILEYRFPLNY